MKRHGHFALMELCDICHAISRMKKSTREKSSIWFWLSRDNEEAGVSISNKTSYHRRPRGYRSHEIGIIISLWNLTGASVALQPRQIAEWLDNSKHKSHGFKTSRDLAKYIETARSQPCRWRHAVPQVGKPQPCDLSTFHLCVSLSLARGRARASLSFTYRLICIGQLPYWSFIRRIAARTPRAPMETSTIATCTCTGADGVPDAAACGGIEVAIDDTNALPSPFVASQQVWGRVTCWAVCARHMEHWAAAFCQSFTVIPCRLLVYNHRDWKILWMPNFTEVNHWKILYNFRHIWQEYGNFTRLGSGRSVVEQFISCLCGLNLRKYNFVQFSW